MESRCGSTNRGVLFASADTQVKLGETNHNETQIYHQLRET